MRRREDGDCALTPNQDGERDVDGCGVLGVVSRCRARVERSRRTAGELEFGEVRYGSSAVSSKLIPSETYGGDKRQAPHVCLRKDVDFQKRQGCRLEGQGLSPQNNEGPRQNGIGQKVLIEDHHMRRQSL